MAQRARRQFASIRQLPSKRWQVRYTGPDGQRHKAPKTFQYKADADAFVEAMRKAIYRESWTDDSGPEQIRFADYAQQWIKGRQVAGRPIKTRTREHYQTILDDHLIPAFGDRLVSTIKPKDVRAWYADTLADRPTLRSHVYSLLRTILNTAVADELIDSNPARIVGAGSAKRVHKIKPASVEQLAVLTNAMPEQLRLMVTLASWCALRFGETIELRRRDIDLTAEVIHVERAAIRSRGGGEFEITTPKSEAGARDVAIPPHILPAIEDHLERFVGSKPDALLFPSKSGGHLQPSTVQRHWYKARASADRPDLRWHDLRHSGAVLAAATGATLAELMARLGHSTPQAAMRYQHAAAGRDREIAALLSKIAANGGA